MVDIIPVIGLLHRIANCMQAWPPDSACYAVAGVCYFFFIILNSVRLFSSS